HFQIVFAAGWPRSTAWTVGNFTVSFQRGDRRICRLSNFKRNGLQNRDRHLK
ncbi:hypothetical protein THAOC_35214, partial [Thalassiosira oceanica]